MVAQLVQRLPRLQSVVGLNPTQGQLFSTLSWVYLCRLVWPLHEHLNVDNRVHSPMKVLDHVMP